METSQELRQHKTAYQQERLMQHIERTLEDKKLEKLKRALQAKLEPARERFEA